MERCDAIGAARPLVVDTYTNLFAGYMNTYTTITNGDIFVITNNFICYTNVTVTNQFLPFEYSWSQTNGTSGTSTCYPSIKRSWFTTWDSKLFSICTSYVDTNNIGTDGTFNDWFVLNSNNFSHSSSAFPKFPTFASTSLLDRAGVGWTNRSVAHWTYSATIPLYDLLLGSINSSTSNDSSWTFQSWTSLSNVHPLDASYHPMVQYTPGGTNTPTNISLWIYGTSWGSLGSNVVQASELATFNSTNDVSLANAWRTITNITCNSARANSNDAIRIAYTIMPALYSENIGWVLNAISLNERKSCVDRLLWSTNSSASRYVFTNEQMSWSQGTFIGGGGRDVPYGLWTQLQANAEASWPGPTNQAPPNFPWSTNTSMIVGSFGWYQWAEDTTYFPHYKIHNMAAALRTADWRITNAPPTNTTAYASCEYYAYSERFGYKGSSPTIYAKSVFNDIDGIGLKDRCYVKVGTSPESLGGRTMSTSIEHDASIPAWCDKPQNPNYVPSPNYYYSSYGYEVYGPPAILYKWDGTNGFKYK